MREILATPTNFYHVFVDFKKTLDRTWLAALWATIRLYDINANLMTTIKCLYDSVTSAVCYDNNIGEWFRTTVGVCQGYLTPPPPPLSSTS